MHSKQRKIQSLSWSLGYHDSKWLYIYCTVHLNTFWYSRIETQRPVNAFWNSLIPNHYLHQSHSSPFITHLSRSVWHSDLLHPSSPILTLRSTIRDLPSFTSISAAIPQCKRHSGSTMIYTSGSNLQRSEADRTNLPRLVLVTWNLRGERGRNTERGGTATGKINNEKGRNTEKEERTGDHQMKTKVYI